MSSDLVLDAFDKYDAVVGAVCRGMVDEDFLNDPTLDAEERRIDLVAKVKRAEAALKEAQNNVALYVSPSADNKVVEAEATLAKAKAELAEFMEAEAKAAEAST